mmetsp:Transcript_2780/g.6474  ORF Transcript_2780/g.6474 Transcript_2780/m.6474 type:complete len:368 (+) Transcript_2780:594-1697(+)
MQMKPPTTLPSTHGRSRFTSSGAMGAAHSPPARSASTRSGLTPSPPTCGPSERRNPSTAATVTKNSLALTVPITTAGGSWACARRQVVATGPHPPPPVASTNPPTSPTGRSHRRRAGGASAARAAWGRWNLRRTTSPSAKRSEPATGRVAAAGREARSAAPPSAPKTPGSARHATAAPSTLRRCRWARPEAAVVPSCARWTEAEAMVGERPVLTRTVADVTPYPIPSEPSTSCAAKPASATPESSTPLGSASLAACTPSLTRAAVRSAATSAAQMRKAATSRLLWRRLRISLADLTVGGSVKRVGSVHPLAMTESGLADGSGRHGGVDPLTAWPCSSHSSKGKASSFGRFRVKGESVARHMARELVR